MDDMSMFLWDTQAFIPFATSFTQSSDSGGRPTKSDDQLTDAGDITRSAGSNDGKETS